MCFHQRAEKAHQRRLRDIAKSGSPLVILQDDGSIYWPIAEAMPAEGQNKRLMPFAGKRVTATGKTYNRGGSTAIVIDNIVESSK